MLAKWAYKTCCFPFAIKWLPGLLVLDVKKCTALRHEQLPGWQSPSIERDTHDAMMRCAFVWDLVVGKEIVNRPVVVGAFLHSVS